MATNAKSSEDFIRSYLLRYKLFDTLQAFQNEFHSMKNKPAVCFLENVYEQVLALEKKVQELEDQMDLNNQKMKENDRMYLEIKKERDVFKTHHVQLTHEKKKSDLECKRLKEALESMQSQLNAMKKKVIKFDRERLNAQRSLENLKSKQDLSEPPKLPPLPVTEKKSNVVAKIIDEVYIPRTKKRAAWKRSKAVKAHEFEINFLLLDEINDKYFTFSDDKTWSLWNSELELEYNAIGHDGHVTCGSLYYDENSPVLFSADSLGIIKVWNIKNNECVHTFKPSQSEIWTMNTNATNLIFGKNNVASLWDINSLELVRDFSGHSATVSYVNFINENSFYSCGIDKTVIIQDTRSAYPIQVLTHKYPMLTASVYGSAMVAADGVGNVFRYDLRYLNDMLVGNNPARLVQSIDFGEHAIHSCVVQSVSTAQSLKVGEDTHDIENNSHPGLLYVACNDGFVYS